MGRGHETALDQDRHRHEERQDLGGEDGRAVRAARPALLVVQHDRGVQQLGEVQLRGPGVDREGDGTQESAADVYAVEG